MAALVARRAGYAGRSGSRSPRRDQEDEDEAEAEHPDAPGPDGLPRNFKGGFSAQMQMQRDFLAGFMRPDMQTAGLGGAKSSTAPKEAAAGLPVEPAQVLLLSPGPGPATPWSGLPAHVACVAATLRLFARLLPGRVSETACDELCKSHGVSAETSDAQEQILSLAQTWGLEAKLVASAVEPLEGMVRNRPATCCVILEDYVGVLEDPETREEAEQEVGKHCVLIVGGDLLGPTYVTFDPWGAASGEVSHWPDHAAKSASPVAWVELSLAVASS
eukprot:TRINITY_DN29959_c0_g1_i1.p1 TRINITY_DN29959_c0_g1~~TRINITY_DN29959_c0_g1_i1.p1  ORF type:complete len:274 (+),score=59.85 TRINITY_DN29959_c0_g1_i1:24-845(+)